MTATSMTSAEFEAAFRALVEEDRARAKEGENVRCYACVRCKGCEDSGFCEDGRALVRCQYCKGCEACVDCLHCDGSRDCLACTHCKACERCVGSAYLVRSIGCTGCTYCFGCVGLSKKDFHILNRPYDRTTYFAMVARLERELGQKPREPGTARR